MRLDSLQHANLADHCYDPKSELTRLARKKENITIEGVPYKVLKQVDNSRNGYHGTIYQHVDSGAIVVAHRGTEPDREFFQDIVLADAGMVATRHNIQSNDAIELTHWALAYAKNPRNVMRYGHPSEVTVTGHSLGGTLAQIAAHHFDLRGETFNAYGAVSLNRRIPEGGDAVINHVVATDVISSASPHYGQVRRYASQAHIGTLHASGYENNRRQLFDPRDPSLVLLQALDFHGMHNFRNVDNRNQPDVSLLRDPQAQVLAAAYDPMIDKYRADIGRVRGAATLGLRASAATLSPRGSVGLARDVAGFMRGDLPPGQPAQHELDRQQPPIHPLGERLHNKPAMPLPDHLSPGATSRPGIELPDYLRPASLDEPRAPAERNVQTTSAMPMMHAPTPHRSDPALTLQHHYTPPSAEPAALAPLSTTQTLEPGDRGAAVQALQQHLRLLGATDRYGQKIEADRDYGDRTRDAVEQFQLWTGREPTGIADPDTLKDLQAQAQFAQRQRSQGIVIAPDVHLTDHLKPATPDRADAAIERPVQGRDYAGQMPFSHPQHPQHALYTDVQQRFQAKGHDLSEAQLSVLSKQMHLGGYKPGWEGDVIVYRGQAVVGAFALGIQQTSVDLGAPMPPVQETMQTFQTDQQSRAEYMERMSQQQTMAHSHGRAM